MTVRTTSKTTISVALLIVGIGFLRHFYVELLSRFIFRNELYSPYLSGKLYPDSFIGGYFPALFYTAVLLVIAVRMVYTILESKVAFDVVPSILFPLLLFAIGTVALCIEQINILQLWAVFYLFLIIVLHSTFKKALRFSESVSGDADLKLFKNLYITIKSIITKLVSSGLRNYSNPVDELTTLSSSAVILVFEALSIISFIAYIAIHWRLIFLAHLIS